MTFPWIHDSEMQAARAEVRLEAEGAFTEAAQEYREFKSGSKPIRHGAVFGPSAKDRLKPGQKLRSRRTDVFLRARAWIWHQIDRIRHRPMENDGPQWRADRTPLQVLTGRVQRPPQQQREITPAIIGRQAGRDAEMEIEAG